MIFMYTELDQFAGPSMSNSELFLFQADKKQIEFDILKRPTFEFIQDDCSHGSTSTTASHDPHQLIQHQQEQEAKDDDDDDNDIKAGKCENAVSSNKHETAALGEFKVDDDNDGFRTPTSLDNKIPVIKQCPPAPRKPAKKPLSSTKRKFASPNARRNLLLDLSKDVESMFPPPLIADIGRKIKKARQDVETTE